MVHESLFPIEVMQLVLYALQPSASIVVFSPILSNLVDLQEYLLQSHQGANVRIEELWTREQQVLPCRTHPVMSMHAASGFILSAIKIN